MGGDGSTGEVCDEVGGPYRFGFNGQEKVNEMSGMGNHNTAEFWEYDTRLGRRWNVDPVDQISVSNYAVFRNNPLVFTDVDGDCVDCDENYPDAEIGDIVSPEASRLDWQKADNGEWLALGGEFNKVDVVVDREGGDLQQVNKGTDFWTGLNYAGLGTTATGGLAEAYGLGKQSLWQSRYGWRSGYTSPISRWTTVGRALGNVGLGVGIIGLGNDARQVSQNKMSWGRFGYHLAGFGTSVYVGAQLGGPYGAAAGVGFGVAELGYDHVIEPYVVEPARQEFNRGFNSWLRGVYRGMGIPGF